ncbi:type 1 glutamine amidotransferase [Salinibacterium soli]|uniref:Cobyric acid synthase n=1 Tax=Antiquaquibacter soli TaxID=3064523 RepID=A0ABT9BM94_9MICO|nr:cobyric acid synthase [Protaetiibacter sp. WY-16]MDO7882089.1 cobyric acid synthase [Protaetiibacter sp. WY-16]
MITILHLYPRELGINGDVGNVLALRRRAQWRGAEVRVVDHEVGAPLPEVAHLVHIGSGPLSAQQLVLDDLAAIAPTLRSWAADGVPFLAVAGGWQLLGRSLVLTDGTVLPGAEVLPSDATLTDRRIVREVWSDDVAGFENHGARTTVDGRPVEWPVARFGSSIATTLHGPFLPMNPTFADELLTVAADRAGVELGAAGESIALVDDYAARSRRAIKGRL